jgi:hypothetical protein
MSNKSPLAIVKDKFGDKAKLVAEVEKLAGEDLWVSRTNKEKGLAHVSNAKLVRLFETFTAVKEKFGTRAKLIEAILEVEKRAKDEGYKQHLSAFPVPRLWDLYKSTAKRLAPKPVRDREAEAKAKKAAATKKAAAPAKTAKKTAVKATKPGAKKAGKANKKKK